MCQEDTRNAGVEGGGVKKKKNPDQEKNFRIKKKFFRIKKKICLKTIATSRREGKEKERKGKERQGRGGKEGREARKE
jgi:hypothetical protein